MFRIVEIAPDWVVAALEAIVNIGGLIAKVVN